MTARELQTIVVRETFGVDPAALAAEQFAERCHAAVHTARGTAIENGLTRRLTNEERDAIGQELADRVVADVLGDRVPPDLTPAERMKLADEVVAAYDKKAARR